MASGDAQQIKAVVFFLPLSIYSLPVTANNHIDLVSTSPTVPRYVRFSLSILSTDIGIKLGFWFLGI